MRRKIKWIAYAMGALIIALSCIGDTNLVITSFGNGMVSWANIDTNLYYSVQWKPSLTSTNDWSASYRSCQDLRSTNQIITAPVPVFFRILGSANPTYTRTISTTNTILLSGYYEETNLTEVEPYLGASNIRAGITIFGITGKAEVVDTTSASATDNDILVDKSAWCKGVRIKGTRQPAPVRNTGQTTSYRTNDDGDLQSGIIWPSPRFTAPDGPESGCVFDHLTGLYWLLDANPDGSKNWNDAVDYCALLSFGYHDDWRLPTVQELQSLIDYSQVGPALPSGHPFTNVQSSNYWAATTSGANTNSAWQVDMNTGAMTAHAKTNSYGVWAVCGGQPGFRLIEWYEDWDGDGYGCVCSQPILATVQPYIGSYPHVSNNLDPDDQDTSIPYDWWGPPPD